MIPMTPPAPSLPTSSPPTNSLTGLPLTRYGQMAQQQWKDERPRMYRRLEQKGKLRLALIAAQEMTKQAVSELVEQGYRLDEAEEIALPSSLYLPTEAEMPMLGQDPSARRRRPDPAEPLTEGNELPDESQPPSRLPMSRTGTMPGTSTPTIKLIQKMLSDNQR